MGASIHAKTPTTARGNDEGWLGLTAASAAAQPTERVTVDAGQDEGGAFVFAQVNATEDGSTGAGGGAFVRPESGGVNTDADAGAAVNDEFTGAGVGAFGQSVLRRRWCRRRHRTDRTAGGRSLLPAAQSPVARAGFGSVPVCLFYTGPYRTVRLPRVLDVEISRTARRDGTRGPGRRRPGACRRVRTEPYIAGNDDI